MITDMETWLHDEKYFCAISNDKDIRDMVGTGTDSNTEVCSKVLLAAYWTRDGMHIAGWETIAVRAGMCSEEDIKDPCYNIWRASAPEKVEGALWTLADAGLAERTDGLGWDLTDEGIKRAESMICAIREWE